MTEELKLTDLWAALYFHAHRLVEGIGYHGEISSKCDAVEQLESALHALDGGQYRHGLSPNLLLTGAEHAQRITLQHHAADLAQRAADLEAERDNTAKHVASISRQLGDESLGVDDIAVQVLALVAERDELRARLAEIEVQEPAIVEAGELRVGFGDTEERVWLSMSKNIPLGTKLYARPVPAIPAGWRLVNSGALAMVINALRRDAEEGRPVRGEMADELLASAPGAAR